MSKLGAIVIWAMSFCAGCAHEPMRADAAALVEPLTISTPFKVALKPSVDVSALPDLELCSRSDVTRDLCVTHFRTAFETGLTTVMGQLFDPELATDRVRIEFRIDKFSHQPTSLNVGGFNTSRVDLAWSLQVIDSNGIVTFELHESTQSPQPMTFVGKHDAVTARLIGATLEDVGRALQAHFKTVTPHPRTTRR